MKRIALCMLAAAALLPAPLVLPATLPTAAFADDAAAADAQSRQVDGESANNTVTATEGWTQLGTLEWKMDAEGCFILRPLGGARPRRRWTNALTSRPSR